MPLSRLDNFLKNVRGNILYVSPNDLDATDSIENTGNSMGRPFLTIQRALIEAARFSYQKGLDNDRFGKTTIYLQPGEHLIDNRPGWIPDGTGNFRLRDGTTSSDFPALNATSNFDINTQDNILYKFNSIHGGVIIPRGISLVGLDLRKVKIRPKYVPNPSNDNIDRSALFRVTGGSYFLQVTMFDGDPNGQVYKDYTTSTYVPNFSHHKLTCFEFADGVNNISINDTFQTYSTDRTDLDVYYEKVGLAYGTASGRKIEPDYPSSSVDIQPKVEEYRIVGPTGGTYSISNIFSGDGTASTKVITVETSEAVPGLNVDTSFQMSGISDGDYNGQFVVNEVLTTTSTGTTKFKYNATVAPSTVTPGYSNGILELDIDTVAGSSPYIFNCSLRSVWGMCGMHADGSKASGFRSMVLAQFTGVSLQKDDNAFVKFNTTSGAFDDSTSIANIHSNSDAKYKPAYANYHIKASNNAVLQLVSIFAVGFDRHFVTESGGDFSITNSNSNFGQAGFAGVGFRDSAFSRDDTGYITNIVPPKEISTSDLKLEWNSIDVSQTIGIGSTSRLYLYGETNEAAAPPSVVQGYRVGAKVNDKLSVGIGTVNYDARIIMAQTEKLVGVSSQISSMKSFTVGRSTGVGGGNSITSNTITFTQDHTFLNGESIRFRSDNARLPDGIKANTLYYAITNSLETDQIQVAATPTDATNAIKVTINALGGTLSCESRVSDKNAGDIGHPVQYDSDNSQWYVGVSTDNDIYPRVVSLGTTHLGDATSRTYITRTPDTRGIEDKLYKVRYVVPSTSGVTSARSPRPNYVLQESSDVTGTTDTEVALLYSSSSVTMSNATELRNPSYIRQADWVTGGTAYYTTEIPHKLSVGSQVKIANVTSANYATANATDGFNGTYTVTGISSANQFYVSESIDPGAFTNNTSNRTKSLPTFQRTKSKYNYYVYETKEIAEYRKGEQDGIYSLTVVDASNTPTVTPFTDSTKFAYSAPIVNLYPQHDRDNINFNPAPAINYALPTPLGEVNIDEPKNSVTRGSIDKSFWDFGVGIGLTDIQSSVAVAQTATFFTDREHGLNRITKVSIASSGTAYGNGTGGDENLYNAILGVSTTGKGATARITVDSSGGITAVKIMDGGSCYLPGDYISVTGTATTTGFTTATLKVDTIYNNIGDTVRIAGVTSTQYDAYNQLYRITGVGTYQEFTGVGINTVSTGSTTGIGATVLADAYSQITGAGIAVSTMTYNGTTGLATVTTTQAHGLRVNNSIVVRGATGTDSDLYNSQFLVTENVGLTTFVMRVGVSTLEPTVAGTLRLYQPGLAAQGGNVTPTDEQYGGRQQNIYAGITTTLSVAATASITTIQISNHANYNFDIGDHLRIDDEIMRIKTTVLSSDTTISVFRGLYGTKAVAHDVGSVIRRLDIQPMEFRRPSIIRGSGHTFEYIGFGPGNYSTALPQTQADQPSFENQVLAQAQSSNGGLVVYTAMDSSGDYYIGNKKIAASSGKERIYNSPVPTVTGEPQTNPSVLTTDNVDASRRIVVDGGEDNDILSEFNGPVLFSQKITSTSDEGIEASSIKIQGDATISRKYTVGIATPSSAGNVGDVTYNADPVRDGTLGWVYTSDSGWYPFGNISIAQTSLCFTYSKVGVGTTSFGENTFQVGSGTTQFVVNSGGEVGIGSTSLGYRLNVNGTTNLVGKVDIRGNVDATGGIVTAYEFHGNGSNLTGMDSIWGENASDDYIYVKDTAQTKVGIGTSAGVDTQLMVGGDNHQPLGPTTSLLVHGRSQFIGTAIFDYDVNVSGFFTSTDYRLDDSSDGMIRAGIVTTTSIQVGSSSTILSSGTGVGIGTATSRASLDVVGPARFETYHDMPKTVSSSSGVVRINLSKAQNFELTTTEDITQFTVFGAASNSATTFTLKIVQDSSTHYGVGIDTFKNLSDTSLSVYWPGGTIPTVTTTAGKTDIYSFMTFDGGTTFYGVIGGQNFS